MSDFDIDGDLIRKLAGLLGETGLSEIEFADGDRRVKVSRGASGAPLGGISVHPLAPSHPSAHEPAAVAAAPPAGAIVSPMVGTAYLAPEPGAAPFLKPGDTVSEGDTLLIIEAMKVMNPIRAPHDGTLRQIVVQDAQPVEFGEVLMILE